MISLVLPSYNPGDGIVRTWRILHEFLRTQKRDWEILFVLDGCSDGTEQRLEQLAKELPDSRMRWLAYSPNRGKGYAVRRGLLDVNGEYRIFTDVDLAYGTEDILRVAEALQAGTLLATASRNHPESEIHLPAHLLGYVCARQWQSRAFHFAVRSILPIRHSDTQAGLKGLTAQVAEHVLPHLSCDGFGFDCELLTACHRAGITATELPVRVRYDGLASTTGSRTGLQMLRELFAIRRSWKHRTLPPLPQVLPSEPLRKAA